MNIRRLVALILTFAIVVTASALTPSKSQAKRQRLGSLGGLATGAPTQVIVTITGLASIGNQSATSGGTGLMPKILYLVDGSGLTIKHTAIIIANEKYSPSVSAQDGRTLYTEGHFKYIHIQDAEALSIDGIDKTQNKLTYNEAPPSGDALCPTQPESESLYFFPHLHDVGRNKDGSSPAFNNLDPVYLQPKMQDKKIAGYMTIDYGSLVAVTAMPVVWDFKRSSTSFGFTHQQLIATRAEWSFAIPSDVLLIQRTDDKGTKRDLLQIKANGTGTIRLTIANAPDPLGIKVLSGTAIPTLSMPVDDHFAVYYDFLTDKTVNKYVPVAAGVCTASGFSADPCLLHLYLMMPDPGDCLPGTEFTIGGLNCGPDSMP